jgi:16S rRNA (guanine(966)-N(2))-methyltransferase RsmD
MRIIAGRFKGRRLAPVRGGIRPTSDKVREAIFSILGEAVAGTRVLDLFAGTGALALEALSRGAASAVLVEEEPAVLVVLRRNVAILGVADRVRIIPAPVQAALKRLKAAGERFELIFLDPPYGRGLAAATLELLHNSGIINASAWVVAELCRREPSPPVVGCLELADLRQYGDTQVAFYRSTEIMPI